MTKTLDGGLSRTPPKGPTLADLLTLGRTELQRRRQATEERKRQEEARRQDAWASLTWNAVMALGELDAFTGDLPADPPDGFAAATPLWGVTVRPFSEETWIIVHFVRNGEQWVIEERPDGDGGGLQIYVNHTGASRFEFAGSLAVAVAMCREIEDELLRQRINAAVQVLPFTPAPF